MERGTNHKTLKSIKTNRHKCWYIIYSMDFTFEISNDLIVTIFFLWKQAFDLTFKFYWLDFIDVDIGFEKYCLVFIIVGGSIPNRDNSWIVMLGSLVNFGLFSEFNWTLTFCWLFLFISFENIVGLAVDHILIIPINHLNPITKETLTIEKPDLDIRKVYEDINCGIEWHLKSKVTMIMKK